MKKSIFLKMLVALFVLISITKVAAAQTKFTLLRDSMALSEAIEWLEKQSNYSFFYTDEINTKRKANVNVQQGTLDDVLAQLLKNSGISYKTVGTQVILYKAALSDTTLLTDSHSGKAETVGAVLEQAKGKASLPAEQQPAPQEKQTVKGMVIDENNVPLPGAVVVLKGVRKAVSTDVNGYFLFENVPADAVLEVSFLGYKTTEYAVNKRSVVEIKLDPASTMLEDVVVTGYQTISKERVTGSFATVNSDVIDKQISYNLASSLEGKIAGVVKNGNDLTIRGISTFNAVRSPLYVIDGFPVEGNNPRFKGTSGGVMLEYDPPSINPEDIENVTVLKDAAAASIYGARAANGVVVITTKKARKGDTQVQFSADLSIVPKYDFGAMNYMSANRYIDFERDYINRYPRIQDPATRAQEIAAFRESYNLSPTMDYLLQVYEGKMTQSEADAGINAYRSDGTPITDDYNEYIYRPAITQRYYLSIGKATEGNNFMGSITYAADRGEYRNLNANSLEVNLRNTLNVAKWLDAEIVANIRSGANSYPEITPDAYMKEPSMSPYTRLVDENGAPIAMPFSFPMRMKAIIEQYPGELQNLDFVLQDELNRNITDVNDLRIRASAMLNFKFTNWLKFSTGLLYEHDQNKTEKLYNKESFSMRLNYDDFTYLDPTAQKLVHRLPYGDSFEKTNASAANFTQRNQLNFNYTTEDVRHSFAALAGTEIRQISGDRIFSRVWGYDSELQDYTPVNNADLSIGRSSILGRGGSSLYAANFFNQSESLNRFVSLYGNAMYTFDQRFDLTGSVRWDLSNLFGMDVRLQYKPTWSAGTAWNISNERFMKEVSWVDRLKLRATYGINGNIAKNVSPYLIAFYSFNPKSGEKEGSVSSPPNPRLRWERTAVTNIAVDFAVLKNRLSGSIEYYNRNSTDLLSPVTLDPAYGVTTQTLNVGSMRNQGVEIDLNGVLIHTADLQWTAGFTFAYNNNKITKLFYKPERVTDLYFNYAMQEGYPLSSMYSFRYAGISDQGETELYNGKGERVSLVNLDNIEDVAFDGTIIAPYTGAIYTSLAYKGFDLSMNFIYKAGHVLRKRVASPHLSIITPLMYDDYDNAWKQAGDEQNPNVTPRITYKYDENTSNRNTHWQYNNSQVESAAYIKLRTLALSYTVPPHLLQKTFFKGIRLQAQAENLFVLAANSQGLDPERFNYSICEYGLPVRPVYSFGLNLSF